MEEPIGKLKARIVLPKIPGYAPSIINYAEPKQTRRATDTTLQEVKNAVLFHILNGDSVLLDRENSNEVAQCLIVIGYKDAERIVEKYKIVER